MATEIQKKYIADLVVLKTKEFKEVKELLIANEIVKDSSETIVAAESIADIVYALSDSQASRFIDVLIKTKEPNRGKVYSSKRVNAAIGTLDHVKAIINGWGFSE